MAVDAPWGAGKTTFLRQWAGELRQAGYPVVFFDAFKNDFMEDAFAALAGQIIALVEDRRKATTSRGEKFISGAIEAAKVIARSSLRAGVKIATLNAVDTKDLEETAKIVGEELSQLEDKHLGELLTRQQDSAATLDSFKQALADLPALLQTVETEAGQSLPLIFIIDELDRCRPVFALEVLERLKHFFSVPNVHFVLGAHLEQLRNSVLAAYGTNLDPGIYLQKFIHLTARLGETGEYRHERVTTKFIDHVVRSLGIEGRCREHVDFIHHVAWARGLSLRAVERVITNLALALAFLPPRRFAPPPLLAGLCILKVTDPRLYEAAINGVLEWPEVEGALRLNLTVPEGEPNVRWQSVWWAYVTNGPLSEADKARVSQGLWNYNFSTDTNLAAWVARNVVERLRPIEV